MPVAQYLTFEPSGAHFLLHIPYNARFLHSVGWGSIEGKEWLTSNKEWRIKAAHFEETLDLVWQYFSPECMWLNDYDMLPPRPKWLGEVLGCPKNTPT